MGIEEKLNLESEGELEPAVKIQEIKIPKNDRELVEAFRNLRDTTEFCVQLVMYSINEQFNPKRINQLCTREEKQKIGYLSDLTLTLQEDNVLRQETIRNLTGLSASFHDSYENWVHVLNSSELAMQLAKLDHKTRLNYKWKVYPTARAEDVLDWLDLYHEEYFGEGNITEKGARELLYRKKGFLRLRL